LDFRVSGVDLFGLFVDAEGKKISFEGGNTVDTPRCIGEGLDQLLFEGAFGLEIVKEALGVGLVGGVVFRREDDDVAGESMAEGVEGGALFAGGGAGAGGALGVGAVGFGAGWVGGVVGCVGHWLPFCYWGSTRCDALGAGKWEVIEAKRGTLGVNLSLDRGRGAFSDESESQQGMEGAVGDLLIQVTGCCEI
jgi:hypothetical protein